MKTKKTVDVSKDRHQLTYFTIIINIIKMKEIIKT